MISTMKLALFLLTILLMAAWCQPKNIPELLKPRERRAVSVTFMDMYVQSEGCNDPGVPAGTCGTAYIKVHGVDHSNHSRGHNIVTVNAQTGVVIDSKAFDTHGVSDAGEKMRDYLNTITGDIVVVVATQDSASNTWLPAKDALMRLGVTEPILMEFRSSFAFIGYAGTNKPSWIAQEQRGAAEGPSIIHLRIALQQSQPEPTMSVYVRSEGCNDPGRTGCGKGFIKVNNQSYSLRSRGINVAVFSSSGVFLETRGFDTHARSNAGLSAEDYLNGLSGEKIVLFAVQDEASLYGGPVLDALKRLGAKEPLSLSYRSSLAFVGYAGSYMPSWIGQAQASAGLGPSIVEALIEPERWHKFTEETYWCTVSGRSLISKDTSKKITAAECHRRCVNKNPECMTVEFWESYNWACFECTDPSLITRYTNTADLAYPVHVWIREADDDS